MELNKNIALFLRQNNGLRWNCMREVTPPPVPPSGLHPWIPNGTCSGFSADRGSFIIG